ncbi:hypothetical protein [Streptomyces sp. NBC_01429]|uniref:hypothetical protein n=1 Tax=Streptomyces sp. NBC_01429 TaxID=2903862 RepID=UPI002E28CF0C|nr:hypothetical protein [Streptomyces sp. NBC_01429]
MSNADPVRRLMRDLRVLSACESLLSALPAGDAVDGVLALTLRHATTAADSARIVLKDRQERRSGGGR